MLNTSTNVFCQYCPRRQGLRRGAVLRSICKAPGHRPAPRWTGGGQVNEAVLFSELRVLPFVSGWECMCEWMSLRYHSCTQTGPWRKMSMAWPAMSAIRTSSGSTCPNHQESAWGATEARQEKVIVEAVRNGFVVRICWSICWTHLQMFSVSTVLGEKASDVEQSWGASAKLPGRRPQPHWTRRGQVNEGVFFSELRILLFVCFRSTHGWMGMDVWANVCLCDAILVRRFWTVEKDV